MARGVVSPGADSDLHPSMERLRRLVVYEGIASENVVGILRDKVSLSGSIASGGGEGAATMMVDSFESLVETALPYLSTYDDDEDEEDGNSGAWGRDFVEKHRKIAEAMERRAPQTPEEFLSMPIK